MLDLLFSKERQRREAERGPFNELSVRDIPQAVKEGTADRVLELVIEAFERCPLSTADPRRLLRGVAWEIEEAHGSLKGPRPVDVGFEREQAQRKLAASLMDIARSGRDRRDMVAAVRALRTPTA